MCRLFESIKLQDGNFFRLKYHQKRVDRAFATLFPTVEPINLFEALRRYTLPATGVYKCRLVYDDRVLSVDFSPYVRREIKSLRLVETSANPCEFKLEDRTAFNTAYDQRGDCDDVILVNNGFLSDTSYSNIALFDGHHWYTPRIPLLYGTNRAELLAEGKIIEKDIAVDELNKYTHIALFNAMVEFGEVVMDVSSVKKQ